MRTKKSLSMGFVAILVLSMAIFMVPTGLSSYENNPAPAIWLDPSFTDTLERCEEFTVSIVVNTTGGDPLNGGSMYLWEYNLYWNTSWLDLVSYTPVITAKPDIYLGWGNDIAYINNIMNTTKGEHWYAVSAQAPASAYVGVHWLCNYTFHVIDAPIEPASAYTGDFDFHLEALSDYDLVDIVPSGDWVIGQYRIHPIEAPKPKLVIKPKKTHGVCGEKFNITIEIYDLVKEWNLWGWEAQLTYDDAYLCPTASYEGPFLPSFVVQPSANTSYINILNHTADTILTAGSFNDANHTAPECKGTYGIVSILEFNASVQTIAPEVVATDFTLHDIKLAGVYPNGTEYAIEYLAPENATYNVPYKVVGWFLDCYTDPVRKKVVNGTTDYIGLGLNATADSYETQDLVILHAYLEYNFQPETGKIVMFEVYGPNRTISIIRTAITNCTGVATIEFTIPNIPAAFGHWVCYQAAQVKIYQKPEDWLFWKVGWIIEITNVDVVPGEGGWEDPTGPTKCEYIKIVVSYKTISFMPCDVLFTVVVLDELLDPIQEETWWIWVEPTYPVLCSERNDTTTIESHIPCFAHAGFATVYVNAFTNFPMLCGCPYCPEATAIFYIVASICPCP